MLYGFVPVDYDTETNTPVPLGARVATLSFLDGDKVVGYYGADFDPSILSLVLFAGEDKWGYMVTTPQPDWLKAGAKWRLEVLNTDLEMELVKEGVVA